MWASGDRDAALGFTLRANVQLELAHLKLFAKGADSTLNRHALPVFDAWRILLQFKYMAPWRSM